MSMSLLRKEEFFEALQAAAIDLAQRYVVFLVDHGPSSRSTTKFWWNHFEEACRALSIPCHRVPKASERWPGDHRRQGKRGIYIFFTMQSLYRDRMGWFRAVRQGAITSDDIVASLDPRVVDEFERCHTFQIGFRGEAWRLLHGLKNPGRIVIWEPYAPLAAVERGMRASIDRERAWDFTYFGALTPDNYDQFRHILRPLAARHRCRCAGKAWRVFSPMSLQYGFSPFMVSEHRGLEILLQGRINLVIHHTHHRRARTLSERLFVSAALGRPVVCDNPSAWQYFTPEEVPVGEDPEAFLALCEDALRNLRTRQEIAREVQEKVRRHYTYLHTVIQLLGDIDAHMAAQT